MAFASVSAPTNVEATAATSIAGALGAGVTVAVGDLLIGIVSQSSATPTNPNSAPAGWSLQDNVSNTSQTPNIRQHYYFKIAVAGDVSKPTYTWGFAVARDLSLQIVSVAGVISSPQPITLNTNYSMKGNGFSASSSWAQIANAITDVDPNEIYIVFTSVSGMIGSSITSKSCDSGFTENGSPSFGGGNAHGTCFVWQAGNAVPNAPHPTATWGFNATKTGTIAVSVFCVRSAQIELDAAQGNAAPTDAQTLAGTLTTQAETNATPTDTQSLAGTLATAAETNAAPSDAQTLAGTVAQSESNAAPTDAQSLAGTLTTAAESNAAPTDSQALIGTVSQTESNAAPADALGALAATVAEAESNAAPSDTQTLTATIAQSESNAAPTDTHSFAEAIAQSETNAAPADTQSLAATIQQAEANSAPSDTQALTGNIAQAEGNAAAVDTHTLIFTSSITQSETNAAPSDAATLAGRIAQTDGNSAPADAHTLTFRIVQAELNSTPADAQAFHGVLLVQHETNVSPTDSYTIVNAQVFPRQDVFSLVVSGPAAVPIPSHVPPPRVAIFEEVIS